MAGCHDACLCKWILSTPSVALCNLFTHLTLFTFSPSSPLAGFELSKTCCLFFTHLTIARHGGHNSVRTPRSLSNG